MGYDGVFCAINYLYAYTMSPTNLFDVILKVIGIFFIRNILEALSRTLSVLIYFPQYNSTNEAFFNLGVTLPPLVLYTLFAWMLLFRTRSLTSWLGIERSFGTEIINISFQRTVVLTMAVLIVGGWMLVTEIPEFFRHAVYYYQERMLYDRMVRPDFSYPLMSLSKIIIGLALVIFHTPFVHFIESISRNRLHMKWWKKKHKPSANDGKRHSAKQNVSQD
jgi:hypothetical protein